MTDIFKSADWAREALAKEEAGRHSIVMRDGPEFHHFATLPEGVTPRGMVFFHDYLIVATDEGPLFYDSAGNLVEMTPLEEWSMIEVLEPHFMLCGSTLVDQRIVDGLRQRVRDQFASYRGKG